MCVLTTNNNLQIPSIFLLKALVRNPPALFIESLLSYIRDCCSCYHFCYFLSWLLLRALTVPVLLAPNNSSNVHHCTIWRYKKGTLSKQGWSSGNSTYLNQWDLGSVQYNIGWICSFSPLLWGIFSLGILVFPSHQNYHLIWVDL